MTRDLFAYPRRAPHQRVRRHELSQDDWNSLAWAYQDEEHARHSDLHLLVERDAALVHFDLSIQYFAILNEASFEDALRHVLSQADLRPVTLLPEWDGISGVYLMVFDEYRQFYIGQASDIRKRVRDHWTKRKRFDHLLFHGKYASVFPVDEFRPLDNTRLYAVRSDAQYDLQRDLVAAADPHFVLKRIDGGQPDPSGVLLFTAMTRQRQLVARPIPVSFSNYQQAKNQLRSTIKETRLSNSRPVGRILAELDMSVHLVSDDDSSFFWSRRDSVAQAAVNGEITVSEYEEFLIAIGESVIGREVKMSP
ncbi:MAG: hypothetical protein ACTHWA_11190 [Arachnia sp.]